MKNIDSKIKLKKIIKNKYKIFVTNKECDVVLGYVNGHGYNIKLDNEGKTYLEYYADGEIEEEELQDIIYRVLEWNTDLLDKNKYDEEEYEKYKIDEIILDALWENF